jgi:hypothetical protein
LEAIFCPKIREGVVKDGVKVAELFSWKNEIASMDGVKDGVFTFKKWGYKWGVMPNFTRK